MKTRQQLIAAGKVWQIHPDMEETILHECGSRSACMKWLRDNGKMRDYKRGIVRIGELTCSLCPGFLRADQVKETPGARFVCDDGRWIGEGFPQSGPVKVAGRMSATEPGDGIPCGTCRVCGSAVFCNVYDP